MHNHQRHSAHVPHLYYDAQLQSAAQSHAEHMARTQQMSHDENVSGHRTVGDRARRAGYTWSTVGENVAAGQKTVSEVMSGWMNSPGHRHNIQNGNFRNIGGGCCQRCKWCILLVCSLRSKT
jgi:uncharacterized protein YkwD